MTRLAPQRSDIAWNAASLASFAGGALLANIVIARAYGPGPAGIFNQTLALYLIASQFAAFGIHFAALREASVASPDQARRLVREMLAAARLPILITVVCGIAFSFVIPHIFQGDGLALSWQLALIGVPFFAISRILMNLAAGLQKFRVFGAAQAARSLLFLALCFVWIALGLPGETIAFAMAASEIVLSIALLGYFARSFGLDQNPVARERRVSIRGFGARAMPAIVAASANTRIDVLVLGIFVEPAVVGVYAVAASIIEGALQLPIAIRPMINTQMARLLAADDLDALRRLVHRLGTGTAALMAVTLGAICLLFPVFVTYLNHPDYAQAFNQLLILALGAAAWSWAAPFDMLLVQAGKLRDHWHLKLASLVVNAVLAFALVPILGPNGAAIAYACSLAANGPMMRALVRRSIGPAM